MDTATDPGGRPFALDVIRPWPDVAREAAYQVMGVHGPPGELDERSVDADELHIADDAPHGEPRTVGSDDGNEDSEPPEHGTNGS